MELNRTRLRRVYEPLTTACHIVATGANKAAVTQTYDVEAKEFDPDRELSPLIIVPDIIATTNDGTWKKVGYTAGGSEQTSWETGSGSDRVVHNVNENCFLADGTWYVNNQSIRNVWNAKDYSVDMSTSPLYISKNSKVNLKSDTYGTLTVKKNCIAGEKYELRFEAKIVDSRIGKNIGIVSNTIILQTVAKMGDELSVSMEKGKIEYNIFKDCLLEYDYETAREIEHIMTKDEAKKVGTPYLQELPFVVYLGSKKHNGECTIRLEKLVGLGVFQTVDTEGISEFVEISSRKLVVDMRMIQGTATYKLTVITADELHEASTTFSLSRVIGDFTLQTVNTGDLTSAKYRRDKVIVHAEGRMLPYPECQLYIQWKTTTINGTTLHNVGENGLIDVEKANIGNGENDAWMEVYVDVEQRGQASSYTDTSGAAYTDEHYYPFIS